MIQAAQGTTSIAVLGTGSIGMRHLNVLGRIAGVRPIGIPRRLERIGQLKKAGYSVAKDLHEAVRKGADLCIVATDTGRHVEDGLAALEEGLDILVEKPLATSVVEARRLYERAMELHRKVFVGCVLRFSESLSMFRGHLQEVGPLHQVQIECRSYLPEWRPDRPYRDSYSARAREGGVLRDLIHEIDYAGWLFGWPAAVQAHVRNLNRLGIETDEVADMGWEIAGGARVTMNLDYLSRPASRRMRAFGEGGTLEWDGITGRVTLEDGKEIHRYVSSSQSRDEMFTEQSRAFLKAVQGISDPRLASAEEGVKALAICDAVCRASEGRREEKVIYP